jgi:hypothetical protein
MSAAVVDCAVRWVPVPHPPQSSGTAALAPVGTAGDREGATGVNMGAPNEAGVTDKDKGDLRSQGVRAEGADVVATGTSAECLRTVRDYLIGADHDGPIRYEQALEIIDAVLSPAAGG